jgi:hypothetical protein
MNGRALYAALRAVVLATASLVLAVSSVRAQAEPSAKAPPSPEPFVIEVFAGAGMGSRAFQRPLEQGLERLDESVFPALEAGVGPPGFAGAAVGGEGGVAEPKNQGGAVATPHRF